MKSAIECFEHAAACERAAQDEDGDNRNTLLKAAEYWRARGEQEKAKDASKATPSSPAVKPP